MLRLPLIAVAATDLERDMAHAVVGGGRLDPVMMDRVRSLDVVSRVWTTWPFVTRIIGDG